MYVSDDIIIIRAPDASPKGGSFLWANKAFEHSMGPFPPISSLDPLSCTSPLTDITARAPTCPRSGRGVGSCSRSTSATGRPTMGASARQGAARQVEELYQGDVL